MFRSHSTATRACAVWNAPQIFDRQMSARLSLHIMIEWEIVLLITRYHWQPDQHPQRFLSEIQSIFFHQRSGDRGLCLFSRLPARQTLSRSFGRCLFLSPRQVGRAALTEPVNQSHSLANTDWSRGGLIVAGCWWDPGLRFDWDDIRQIHGT